MSVAPLHQFRHAAKEGWLPSKDSAAHDSLASTVNRQIQAGFDRVGARLWVGPSNAHIRPIFEFQAMKGGMLSARWGVSIEFVPQLKGRNLLRSKGKTLDLCIDPIDSTGDIVRWCAIEAGDSSGRIGSVVSATMKAANEDWQGLTTLHQVVAWFERSSQMLFRRFSPDAYTQTYLCWGLCLIAIGRPGEGERHLRRFCGEYDISSEDRVLIEAIAKAGSLAA